MYIHLCGMATENSLRLTELANYGKRETFVVQRRLNAATGIASKRSICGATTVSLAGVWGFTFSVPNFVRLCSTGSEILKIITLTKCFELPKQNHEGGVENSKYDKQIKC